MSRSRSRSRSPSPSPSRNSSPAPNGGGAGDPDGVKIHIGNLSFDTDEERLRTAFSDFGSITDVFLPKDRMNNNRPRGYGFVTFADQSAADKAIA
eukprot:12495314-Ditylum_brightwellii.AAC.1